MYDIHVLLRIGGIEICLGETEDERRNTYFVVVPKRKDGRVQGGCDRLGMIVGEVSKKLSPERVMLVKRSFRLIASHPKLMGVRITKYAFKG